MRIPQLLANADEFAVRPKDMPDEMMDNDSQMNKSFKKPAAQMVKATVDWKGVIQRFSLENRDNLPGEIALSLLQAASSAINKEVLNKYTDNSSKENYIKSAIIQLMCTPEYQLC
jgi:hypothetical protein